MTEPTIPASAGVVALGITLLGPAAGPYAAIVLSSLAGALWALAAAPTDTRRAGAALLLRLVLTAVVLTVGIAVWIERQYGWPAHDMLPAVAFGIGMGGDRWRAVGGMLVGLLRRRAATALGDDGSAR